MELKAAGWINNKQMIWGAGQHIMDKETRCALVRFSEMLNLAYTAGREGLARLTSLTLLDVRVSLRSGHNELCGGGALLSCAAA